MRRRGDDTNQRYTNCCYMMSLEQFTNDVGYRHPSPHRVTAVCKQWPRQHHVRRLKRGLSLRRRLAADINDLDNAY